MPEVKSKRVPACFSRHLEQAIDICLPHCRADRPASASRGRWSRSNDCDIRRATPVWLRDGAHDLRLAMSGGIWSVSSIFVRRINISAICVPILRRERSRELSLKKEKNLLNQQQSIMMTPKDIFSAPTKAAALTIRTFKSFCADTEMQDEG